MDNWLEKLEEADEVYVAVCGAMFRTDKESAKTCLYQLCETQAEQELYMNIKIQENSIGKKIMSIYVWSK
jgi:hypothetical protein